MNDVSDKMVFIKSDNNTKKIYLNYMYSLIGLTIVTIIINLILKNNVIPLVKSIVVSLVVSLIINLFVNIIKKEDKIININAISTGLLLGLFGANVNIIVLVVAVIVSTLVATFIKKIELSQVLFGMLIIILYKYYIDQLSITSSFENIDFNIKDSLLGVGMVSPILLIIIFIYLFCKKSIKYNLVIPYVLTFFGIIFLYGIFNNNDIWYGFKQVINSWLLYIVIYALTDYQVTPTLVRGQIVYGIVLGIISVILKFIVPELYGIITIILGMLMINNIIDKVSYKLKYSHKLYYMVIISLLILAIIALIVLLLLF